MQQEQTYTVRFEELEVVANSKEEALESALAYLRRANDSIVKEIGTDLKDPVREAIAKEEAENVSRIVREDARQLIWTEFPQVTDEDDIERMIDVLVRRLDVDWAENAICVLQVWCDDILEKYDSEEIELSQYEIGRILYREWAVVGINRSLDYISQLGKEKVDMEALKAGFIDERRKSVQDNEEDECFYAAMDEVGTQYWM